MSIEETLAERQKRYGTLRGHAAISQGLKAVMQYQSLEDQTRGQMRNWDKLSDDKKEALEMIVHKIVRILNGSPEYRDNWHDICGYAKLIEDTLEEQP